MQVLSLAEALSISTDWWKPEAEEALMLWSFGEENRRLLEEHVIGDRAATIGFERKGSFSLASESSEFSELKESAKLMEELKINVDVLDEQDVRKRLGCQGFAGGIKYQDDASVDPVGLVELIKRELKNTEVFEGNEVFELNHFADCRSKNTVEVFESGRCDGVNGYAPLLHPCLKMSHRQGQILAISCP